MNESPWKRFERLTREIFSQMATLEGFNILELRPRPDEKGFVLTGLSTAKHQIDAYMKIMLLGQEHEIVFEAKDWSRPVDKPRVMAFRGVLDDLPRRPTGVMFTRAGFCEGNILPIAQAYGIRLYVLEQFDSADLPFIDLAVEGAKVRLEFTGFKLAEERDIPLANELLLAVKHLSTDLLFYRADGSVKGNLGGLARMILNNATTSDLPDSSSFRLDFTDKEPIYWRHPDSSARAIRVTGLIGRRVRKDLGSKREVLRMTHWLHLLTGDNRYYIDESGRVHRSSGTLSPTFLFVDPENGRRIKLNATVDFSLDVAQQETDSND